MTLADHQRIRHTNKHHKELLQKQGQDQIFQLFICKKLLFYGHLYIHCLNRFISSTLFASFTFSSTHAGRKPLRMAFLADFTFDHAQQ